jgi:hypothetical protein
MRRGYLRPITNNRNWRSPKHHAAISIGIDRLIGERNNVTQKCKDL